MQGGRGQEPDPEIERHRREFRADPASLRFVQYAEALRRAGRVVEAEHVVSRGLAFHPGLKSAELLHARILATTGRRPEALGLLDDLYPRDVGNLALVTLYLDLLVEAGRGSEATSVLSAAEQIGLPDERIESYRQRIEEGAGAAPDAEPAARKALPASPAAAVRAWWRRVGPALGRGGELG